MNISHYCLLVFIFALLVFFIFELLFLNGINTMKHGRKFHFGIIYLFKFILYLKFEKSSRFFRVFFSILKLKIMIFEVYNTQFFDSDLFRDFSISELKIRAFDEVYAYLILQFVVVFPVWNLCKKSHIDSICLFDVIVH